MQLWIVLFFCLRDIVAQTVAPSVIPSRMPSVKPSSAVPTTYKPTVNPTIKPSTSPSLVPTVVPSMTPTTVPSRKPTTIQPTVTPSYGMDSFYISTFAGNGVGAASPDGVTALGSSIKSMKCLWADTIGIVYFSEYASKFRSIDSSGILGTLAGSGTNFANSVMYTTNIATGDAATSAGLYYPNGVWGNGGAIYITETYKSWSVTDGIVTLFAGNGGTTFIDNVPATSSGFITGRIVGDTLGNIYFTSTYRVVKVSSDGIVRSVAGTGTSGGSSVNVAATSTGVGTLYCMTIDSVANIYVYDSSFKVKKISTVIATFAGTGAFGTSSDGFPATSTNMGSECYGLWIDSVNNFYYSDSLQYKVKRVHYSTRVVTTVAGTGSYGAYDNNFGPATSATIALPIDLQGATTSSIYVGDNGNYLIRALTTSLPPTSSPTFSINPTINPSMKPSVAPTLISRTPTLSPTRLPSTQKPSVSYKPSLIPSASSASSTLIPSAVPIATLSDAPSEDPTEVPSVAPSALPTLVPTDAPTVMPSVSPTLVPTEAPSVAPSVPPTIVPSKDPSVSPSLTPTLAPSGAPSVGPSVKSTVVPSNDPSVAPSAIPTLVPSKDPSVSPSLIPTLVPSGAPSLGPSVIPTLVPSKAPSLDPSMFPSLIPSLVPSQHPSLLPSVQPSLIPTVCPSMTPSKPPSLAPTLVPTKFPTAIPSTRQPSLVPSIRPSTLPSLKPSVVPSQLPSLKPSSVPSVMPTLRPSKQPSEAPTVEPSVLPSFVPSEFPTEHPSVAPSLLPTIKPSSNPSIEPTVIPSLRPSVVPSVVPSQLPSRSPSRVPSITPTICPTVTPTVIPTLEPTVCPTSEPSLLPSERPSEIPTVKPSNEPTEIPTEAPTEIPTEVPSTEPSVTPTTVPSVKPSHTPSIAPSRRPSQDPSIKPSPLPSAVPTVRPSRDPSVSPTRLPSALPSVRPTVAPSVLPSLQPSLIPTSPSISPTSVEYYNSHPRASLPSNQSISVVGLTGQRFKIVVPFVSMSSGPVGNVFSDIVLAAEDTSSMSYVVFGGAALTSSYSLTSAVKYSDSVTADSSKRSVSLLGDVNGDGFNDIIIGDGYASKCYVMLGNVLGLTSMTQGFTIFGEAEGDLAGWSVSGAGDINNDTLSDIIVGAPFANGVGAIYVIYGRRLNNVDVYLNNLTASQGFAVYGAQASDYVGVAVSNAGDVNGDGCDDLIFGAVLTSKYYAGAAFVVYGGRGLSTVMSVSQLTPQQGYKLSGTGVSYGYYGCSVSAAGDVNKDGLADVLIGSSPQRSSLVPTAYLVYGTKAGSGDVSLTSMASSQGVRLTGGGMTVSYLGDINHDGYDDVMVGSSLPASTRTGYVLYAVQSVSSEPRMVPTVPPVLAPTCAPTRSPLKPSVRPSLRPSRPTPIPIVEEQNTTASYSIEPSEAPSWHSTEPSEDPSEVPSRHPSVKGPSEAPTIAPTVPLTERSSHMPSVAPTIPFILTRSPRSYPTLSPTTEAPTSASKAPTLYELVTINHSMILVNLSRSHQHYLINTSDSVSIYNMMGFNKYSVMPHAGARLFIVYFNESNDCIDLTAFPFITDFSQLLITEGSVIVTLVNDQIIHILNQHPSNVNASNFVFYQPAAEVQQDSNLILHLSVVAGCLIGIGGLVIVCLLTLRLYSAYFKWYKGEPPEPHFLLAIVSAKLVRTDIEAGDGITVVEDFDTNDMIAVSEVKTYLQKKDAALEVMQRMAKQTSQKTRSEPFEMVEEMKDDKPVVSGGQAYFQKKVAALEVLQRMGKQTSMKSGGELAKPLKLSNENVKLAAQAQKELGFNLDAQQLLGSRKTVLHTKTVKVKEIQNKLP